MEPDAEIYSSMLTTFALAKDRNRAMTLMQVHSCFLLAGGCPCNSPRTLPGMPLPSLKEHGSAADCCILFKDHSQVSLVAGALLGSCQTLAAGKRAHCAGLQALDAKHFKMTTTVYNAFLKVGSAHRVLSDQWSLPCAAPCALCILCCLKTHKRGTMQLPCF